jgi:hypothetical protein
MAPVVGHDHYHPQAFLGDRYLYGLTLEGVCVDPLDVMSVERDCVPFPCPASISLIYPGEDDPKRRDPGLNITSSMLVYTDPPLYRDRPIVVEVAAGAIERVAVAREHQRSFSSERAFPHPEYLVCMCSSDAEQDENHGEESRHWHLPSKTRRLRPAELG